MSKVDLLRNVLNLVHNVGELKTEVKRLSDRIHQHDIQITGNAKDINHMSEAARQAAHAEVSGALLQHAQVLGERLAKIEMFMQISCPCGKSEEKTLGRLEGPGARITSG